jgi:regulator of cell morphogenesis and NO signaling
MKATIASTLADIVKEDFRAATVLSGYHLDFCCKGGRSLSEACGSKGVDPHEVLRQIEQELNRNNSTDDNFTSWSPGLLTRYIEEHHHAYIRSVAPVISAHLTKVARVHGGRHPEIIRAAHLFEKLIADLEDHMAKEEIVLFPYIRGLADGEHQHNYPFPSVAVPVRNMMTEHEMAGDDMEEIRTLTGNYKAPEDACTTYRIMYMELEEFEQNLHKHVHLENNILFPHAIELEKQPRNRIPINQL